MGEALYSARLTLPRGTTRANGERVLFEVRSFLLQGCEAYGFWQRRRMEDGAHSDDAYHQFWDDLNTLYPDVWVYIATTLPTPIDWLNGLAGYMSFGEPEEIIDGTWLSPMEGFGNWDDKGNRVEIVLSRLSCWHFTDWQPLMRYLTNRFGFVRDVWWTDEDDDCYEDGRDEYEWYSNEEDYDCDTERDYNEQ